MSILNTGRLTLGQANDASAASTSIANQRAASNSQIKTADYNAKQSVKGQAAGSGVSMGLAAYGAAPATEAGLQTANASLTTPGAANAAIPAANAPGIGAGGLGGGAGGIGNAGSEAAVNAITPQLQSQVANQASTAVANQATTQVANQASTAVAQEATAEVAKAASEEALKAGTEELIAQGTEKVVEGVATQGLASTMAATASAVIPFIGWAASAGMLAYSLFG